MRVKCLAQKYNTMTRPGLEPGPLDPESSALTTRLARLPYRRVYIAKWSLFLGELRRGLETVDGVQSHCLFVS